MSLQKNLISCAKSIADLAASVPLQRAFDAQFEALSELRAAGLTWKTIAAAMIDARVPLPKIRSDQRCAAMFSASRSKRAVAAMTNPTPSTASQKISVGGGFASPKPPPVLSNPSFPHRPAVNVPILDEDDDEPTPDPDQATAKWSK